MILVVLTYPKHFHITQLAVRHAIKYIPNIKKVFLVWDDTHNIIPTISLQKTIRQNIDYKIEVPIINWSTLIPQIPGNRIISGNAGQQVIKLYLDLIINDNFVILDGDTIINHPVDPENILYSSRTSITHLRYNHVNHALGIPNYEFWTNQFMYVKADWLRGLRNHVESVTGQPILDMIGRGNDFPLFEWELIARYTLDILKLPRKIEYFDKAVLSTTAFQQSFNLENNFVLDGPDDFSLDFMNKHKITVDKNLITQLGYVNQCY